MITEAKVKRILTETRGKCLRISFLGMPRGRGSIANVFTHHGNFELAGGRLRCEEMEYSRSIKKVMCICKGDELLYGRMCRSCKKPVPKSHGNCFRCYSRNIASRF